VTRCAEAGESGRILSPLLKGRLGDDSHCVDELFEAVAAAASATAAHAATAADGAMPCAPCTSGRPAPTRDEVGAAYRSCVDARARAGKAVRSLFPGIVSSFPGGEGAAGNVDGEGLGVVLVGRPYAIFSEALGKNIPSMIAKRGVDVLCSDMLLDPAPGGDLDPLLSAFHWRYAVEVLRAAGVCAAHCGLYPVLVTSFKCSPDSFAIEWFKRILDGAGKPYLILQIDEHDSSVGYETRIEAGLRSFRNHALMKSHNVLPAVAAGRNGDGALGIAPKLAVGIRGRKVLVPCWDPLVSPLVAANLRGCGIDALVLEESRDSIRRAMGGNTGQCIPISIIARECAEYIDRHDLDPAGCVLWIAAGMWPCNIPLYAEFGKSILEHIGGGMEKVEVYRGQITFFDMGLKAMIGAYHAFLAGGTLRRLVCRTRPYELEHGAADRLAARAMGILVSELEGGRNMASAYREAFMPFRELPLSARNRPKVAIFGDLYARDNDVLNQDLVRVIEASGGEAITTSYLDYVKAVIDAQFAHLVMDGKMGEWATLKAEVAVLGAVEKALSIRTGLALDPPEPWTNPEWAGMLGGFGIRPEQEGECFDNAIKILRLLEVHPDISLFVETNPAFCCPSIVTEAMSDDIERVTGVPVVSITYDGTGAPKNDVVIPFLALRG